MGGINICVKFREAHLADLKISFLFFKDAKLNETMIKIWRSRLGAKQLDCRISTQV